MKHIKTLIALSVIASSLLAGSAFAGREGGFMKKAPSAKQAEQAQRAVAASGPTQTVASQKQPCIK